MKRLVHPYGRIVLILSAWALCVRQVYVDFDHSYSLDALLLGALIVLAGSVSVLLFFADYRSYRASKKTFAFIPTLCTLAGIATLIGTGIGLKHQDRTPIVFRAAGKIGLADYLGLDLRKDGTYRFEHQNKGFLSDTKNRVRGNYSIRDSIIYLDRSNFYGLIKTDRLLMKAIVLDPGLPSKRRRSLIDLLLGVRPAPPDTVPKQIVRLYQLTPNGDTLPGAITLDKD